MDVRENVSIFYTTEDSNTTRNNDSVYVLDFLSKLEITLQNPSQTKGTSLAAFVSFSFFITLIFCVGLLTNMTALYVHVKERRLWTRTHHALVSGLNISDTILCLSGMWMTVSSSFAKSWLFGRAGCVYYGVTTTALGLTQISLLAAIAVDRYLIINQPPGVKRLKVKDAKYIILICLIFGTIWAIMPALGWNSYQLEGIQLRCAMNWRAETWSDRSYLLTVMVCAWLLPLGVIIFCYVMIYRTIRTKERTTIRQNMRRNSAGPKRFRSRDKNVALMSLMFIGAFFLSWSPYSVVTILMLAGDAHLVPPQAFIVPALVAKSSVIWNPIVYTIKDEEFRRACMKHVKISVFVFKLINLKVPAAVNSTRLTMANPSPSWQSGTLKTNDESRL